MDREIRLLTLSVFAAAILSPALAVAQTPPRDKAPVVAPVAPQTQHVDPKACGNGTATVGQGGIDVQKQPGANLSDKLARSNGVICPPAGVDPEIREPTPPGGNMPVIPPPGSPGGNPNVQPK
jgi:opacity protein-like surface antigen